MHEDSVVAICVPILFVFRRGAARRRLFDVVTMRDQVDFLLKIYWKYCISIHPGTSIVLMKIKILISSFSGPVNACEDPEY